MSAVPDSLPGGRGKRRYSVQMTYMTIYFLLIALMVALLGIFPTISSRDVVFSAKQSLMTGQASVMASSLSALETLSAENVGPVMELVDINAFDRVLVTDDEGIALYDSAAGSPALGRYALFYEVWQALEGQVVFRCSYDGAAFRSRTATPVVSYGEITGAVYLYETDSGQAGLINGIQLRLRNLALIAGTAALLAIFVFTKALTRRITELAKAMRVVREGDYAARIQPGGRDEVTELASEFNEMAARLQSTEELRRRFVSDASHELRTPLASIRLLADSVVQSRNMDEGTMREFVTDIGTEAERLQRMTEKLMRLTKMDSGISEGAQRVDAAQVAEKAVHLLKPLAEANHVSVNTRLGQDCYLLSSEDDIHQIVFNLAENAVKYNSYGGEVFILLERTAGSVRLTVEDTGIGIPTEDMPNIFDRFYRVDKARSSEAGGSGLGLSIVQEAVQRWGGEISVGRREGGGTRFVAAFPAADGEAEGGEYEEE